MKIKNTTHHLTDILLYEKKHRPKRRYFRKKYIGTHPVLLIVRDSHNLNRAKYWAYQLHKQFDLSTVATNSTALQPYEAWAKDHHIQSIIVINLTSANEQLSFSSNQPAITQFLSHFFQQFHSPFNLAEACSLQSSFHFTTCIDIGTQLSFEQYKLFFDFFLLFVPVHIRLSLTTEQPAYVTFKPAAAGAPMPLNKVALHENTLRKLNLGENDYVLVFNPQNLAYGVGVTSANTSCAEDTIRLSAALKNKLQFVEDAQVLVHPLKKLQAKNIVVQKINNLQDSTVFLSTDLFKQFVQTYASHYEIVNPLTGASYDVPATSLKQDASLKENSIRLNYMTREFLDYEQPPTSISPFYEKLIQQSFADDSSKQETFKKLYKKGILQNKTSYDEKNDIKKLLKQVDLYEVDLYPLPKNKKPKRIFFVKKLWLRFLQWVIRPAALSLKVIRPYSTDESSNIVRMTKNAMSLLGIAENDVVTLTYRGKSVDVLVLELDSYELIKETNILPNEAMMNVSIGIPASLRAKLGMKKIGVVCGVERNLPFFFKKHSNMQFISIIATVIAISSLSGLTPVIKGILIVFIIPLIIYVSLSNVREKIQKK